MARAGHRILDADTHIIEPVEQPSTGRSPPHLGH